MIDQEQSDILIVNGNAICDTALGIMGEFTKYFPDLPYSELGDELNPKNCGCSDTRIVFPIEGCEGIQFIGLRKLEMTLLGDTLDSQKQFVKWASPRLVFPHAYEIGDDLEFVNRYRQSLENIGRLAQKEFSLQNPSRGRLLIFPFTPPYFFSNSNSPDNKPGLIG